jgi:6-phosphogluconate dehydrogenase
MKNKVQWGMIGMGVMGTSLSRNFAQKGIPLMLYNRFEKGREEGVAELKKASYPELKSAQAFENLAAFIAALAPPRKLFMMLPSGKPTTVFLKKLVPLLSEGDLIIDGGNAHFEATNKNARWLKKGGFLFLGIGVSGGEEGALKGPSLMVGGDPKAYALVKKDLHLIAAKNKNQKACCAYFGPGGAGHYVKMIHNGIEYAEMQLLAEVSALGRAFLSHTRLQKALKEWNATESKSYLLEITAALFSYSEENRPFIDLIKDQASNKGTGAWATAAASALAYPNTLMASALHARFISAFKTDRETYAHTFGDCAQSLDLSLSELKKSYDLSRWINHHQGFELLSAANKTYKWTIELNEVATVWAEGCIIKSTLLEQCIKHFEKNRSLLLSEPFYELLKSGKAAWKKTLQQAITSEIAVPCMQAAWTTFSALKSKESSANLIQAQRDFFGAHGFERIDQSDEGLQHGPWSQ